MSSLVEVRTGWRGHRDYTIGSGIVLSITIDTESRVSFATVHEQLVDGR